MQADVINITYTSVNLLLWCSLSEIFIDLSHSSLTRPWSCYRVRKTVYWLLDDPVHSFLHPMGSTPHDVMAFIASYKQLHLFCCHTCWHILNKSGKRVCIISFMCLVGTGNNPIQTFGTTDSDELTLTWQQCSVWGHYRACSSRHTCSPGGSLPLAVGAPKPHRLCHQPQPGCTVKPWKHEWPRLHCMYDTSACCWKPHRQRQVRGQEGLWLLAVTEPPSGGPHWSLSEEADRMKRLLYTWSIF